MTSMQGSGWASGGPAARGIGDSEGFDPLANDRGLGVLIAVMGLGCHEERYEDDGEAPSSFMHQF